MEGCVHRMPTSGKSMRTTQDEPGIRPALLQYMIGTFALALVCCSLLCIYFYTTPAHADPGYQQANSKTMTGQVAFDETETDTPSPTVTNTPSPTVTTTSTPTPLPSATRTTTPSPHSQPHQQRPSSPRPQPRACKHHRPARHQPAAHFQSARPRREQARISHRHRSARLLRRTSRLIRVRTQPTPAIPSPFPRSCSAWEAWPCSACCVSRGGLSCAGACCPCCHQSYPPVGRHPGAAHASATRSKPFNTAHSPRSLPSPRRAMRHLSHRMLERQQPLLACTPLPPSRDREVCSLRAATHPPA